MSKNWKTIIPSAKVYDIPWQQKNCNSIDQFRIYTSQLDIPRNSNSHLWLIDLSNFDCEPYMDSLSRDEKEKLHRFVGSKEKETRCKSRILLRIILAEYVNISPSEIVFSYTDNGKPALENPANKLTFNLSHSANKLAILIDSSKAVGIDIESKSTVSKTSVHLANRFFHGPEITLLQQISDKEQSNVFMLLWTLKEAVLKSNGLGVFAIDKAPDFSFIIKKRAPINLQFYTTNNHCGYTFQTQEFVLSVAAEKYE